MVAYNKIQASWTEVACTVKLHIIITKGTIYLHDYDQWHYDVNIYDV